MPKPSSTLGDGGSTGELNPQQKTSAPSISFIHATWALLLSLTVLGVIGYFTFDPATFGQLVRRMSPWYLVAAIGTVVVRVLFGGWRLRYVSHGRVTLRRSVRGQLAWDFFSNITPSAIGGAPVAAVYIARDSNIRMGESTAIMLFSMLLDQLWFAFGIPALLVASFYYDVFPDTLGRIGTGAFILYFVGMLVWVLLFAYATLVRPDFLERLINKLFRLRWLQRFRERAEREMSQLRRRALVLRAQPPRFFITGLLLTTGIWLMRFLTLVFVVWSVDASVGLMQLTLRAAALHLGSLIMPTPGGSGGIEGLYALFIAPLIPSAVVAPTLLTWRLLAYYVFIALGVYLTMHQVRQTMRQRQEETGLPAPSNGYPVEPARQTDNATADEHR